MQDEIILVDNNDIAIGYGEKMDVHRRELLHRAFSVFIYDWQQKKMLLQKRAHGKYHSGGLWTNACCSHPRKGESMEACLNDRLLEELGIHTAFHIADPAAKPYLRDGRDVIYSCGKFSYYAPYDGLSEHEIDHVFLYSPVTEPLQISGVDYNPEEIDELLWIDMDELKQWMADKPEDFTAWFRPAFERAYAVWLRQAKELSFFEKFR